MSSFPLSPLQFTNGMFSITGFDSLTPHRNLFSSFTTSWSDPSAVHAIEPDFLLPQCYSVNVPVRGRSARRRSSTCSTPARATRSSASPCRSCASLHINLISVLLLRPTGMPQTGAPIKSSAAASQRRLPADLRRAGFGHTSIGISTRRPRHSRAGSASRACSTFWDVDMREEGREGVHRWCLRMWRIRMWG